MMVRIQLNLLLTTQNTPMRLTSVLQIESLYWEMTQIILEAVYTRALVSHRIDVNKKGHTNVSEICASFLDTSRESLFTLTDPDTGVVVLEKSLRWVWVWTGQVHRTNLLVGLVRTLGVTNLGLKIARLALDEVLWRHDVNKKFMWTLTKKIVTYPDTSKVCELSV